MSEQKIQQFRELATQAAPIADFEELQGRGTRMRRRRFALGAGAAAALLAIVATATGVGLRDVAGPPDPAGPPTGEIDPMRLPLDVSTPVVLEPGTYRVQYDGIPDVRIGFDVPSDDWKWAGDGLVRTQGSDGGEPFVRLSFLTQPEMNIYECPGEARELYFGQDLADPAAMVAPLTTHPGLGTTGEPARTARFGLEGVHLGLRTNKVCGGSLWLGGPGTRFDFDVNTVGQRIESWFFPVGESGLLVAATSQPDQPEGIVADLEQLLDSVQISVGEFDSVATHTDGRIVQGDLEVGPYLMPVTGGSARHDFNVTAHFDTPAQGWAAVAGGGDVSKEFGPIVGPIVSVGIVQASGVALEPCSDPGSEVVPLTAESAEPLVRTSGARVLEPPRTVTFAGREATHLRLTLPVCPEGEGLRWLAAADGRSPTWVPNYAQPFDVWHVPLEEAPGQFVLVSTNTRLAKEPHLAEMRGLLDSLTFTVEEKS